MQDYGILQEMVKIYGTKHYDWMGFEIRKNNRLTYHHIVGECNGGEETLENGALLTSSAHYLLHRTEKFDKELFKEYNYWFEIINQMEKPICEEVEEIMKNLRERLQVVIDNNIKKKNKKKKKKKGKRR